MRTKCEVRLDCFWHCEQSRNYSTVVEELVVVTWVGCEISLNRKRPSKIYVACFRVGKISAFIREESLLKLLW